MTQQGEDRMYTMMIRNSQTDHVWKKDGYSSSSKREVMDRILLSNLGGTDYALVSGNQIVYTELGGYADQAASLKGLKATLAAEGGRQ